MSPDPKRVGAHREEGVTNNGLEFELRDLRDEVKDLNLKISELTALIVAQQAGTNEE